MPGKKKSKEAKKSKPVKQVTEKQRGNKLLMWICVAGIALITFVVFSPSLDNGFTNWDDNTYVTENPLVMSNAVQVAKIFETPVSSNYHPLTVLSLALNYHDGKLDPEGYHLENIIFHVLNTILVFFFIFLLTRRNILMAAIVALFFGIHPMHVESVTWVSERKDVLYLFFFLLGLITYLRYRETKKILWYFFTLLLFILSCLSKGMAVVFPVILLLIDYLENTKWQRRFIIEKIPFFILSIVFGIVAAKVQSGQAIASVKGFNIFHQVMFASYSAVMYIVKLFIPLNLSAFYPHPGIFSPNDIPLVYYLSPLLLLALLAALIYFFRKKEKEIVFGLLFYFVSVALVLQFVSVGRVIIADRYSYLSYIGLLFIIAYLINKAWQNNNSRLTAMKYPFLVITIIAAVAFSYQSYARTQVWKNSETLWTDVIANYPDISETYEHRAEYYYGNNEKDKALPDYTKAMQLDSTNKNAYYNRAILYMNTTHPAMAITDFTKFMRLDSTNAEAFANRGILYLNNSKINLAIADFNKALQLNPNHSIALYNRGLIYFNYGKYDLALADYSRAIAADPAYADAYSNRGLLYLNTGKINPALADFNKAIAINPSTATYFYNRALCYRSLNQYQMAVDDFTRGIQLNPQDVNLYYNTRGICDISLEKYNDAIADFSKAIALNPSDAGYWQNRAYAENKTGQNDLAKADALKAKQLQVPHP